MTDSADELLAKIAKAFEIDVDDLDDIPSIRDAVEEERVRILADFDSARAEILARMSDELLPDGYEFRYEEDD